MGRKLTKAEKWFGLRYKDLSAEQKKEYGRVVAKEHRWSEGDRYKPKKFKPRTEGTFGGRLWALRTERRLYLREVADAVGVHHSLVSLWERNLRSPYQHNIVGLARFFGVSADYLLGLSSKKELSNE